MKEVRGVTIAHRVQKALGFGLVDFRKIPFDRNARIDDERTR